MPDTVVTTRFTGKDLLSRTFGRMGKAALNFANSTDRSFKRASRSASNFKSITGGILTAGLISRGMGLAKQGLMGVTQELITFDDSITAAAAKFPESIQRGTKEFKELQSVAREVGANTKYSATEAAAGLDFLAMAGFNAKQAMAALPGLTDLATAGKMDLARASDIASDALGAFGLMTKDTAQLTVNLTRVNDVLAKTANMANLDLEMFYETMKQAAPIATAAGSSIEEVSALMAAMAGSGIKASLAGTTLKNMFLQLQKPGGEAKKILKDLKVEVIDSKTKALRPMIDIMGDLEKATAGMGKAQKGAYLETIFGKRAIAGVSSLLETGKEKLTEYKTALDNSGGTAKRVAGDIEKSLGNKLLALKSAAIEVGLKFFDAFEGKIPGAIDKAIDAVRNFDVKPVIETVKRAVDIIGKLYNWITRMKPVIMAVAAAWVYYRVQMKAAMMLDAAAQFIKITHAAQAAAGAKGIGGFAKTALNNFGKTGVATVAIGAVALAVYQIYKNSDALKAAWNTDFKDWWQGWDSVKGIISEAGDEALRLLGITQDYKKEIQKVPESKEPKTKNIKVVTDPNMMRLGSRMKKGKPPGDVKIREAPNKTEVETTNQNVNFQGELNIKGAPEGSTVKSNTKGAKPVKVALAGAN